MEARPPILDLKTVSLACALFLHLCGYYFLKPVRDALLLSNAGIEALPWTYLLQSIVAVLGVVFTNVIAACFTRKVFAGGISTSFVAVCFLFALLFHERFAQGAVAAIVFYTWTTVLVLMAVNLVWTVAATRLTITAGRRSYLLIALAGSVGAIAGSFFATRCIAYSGLQGAIWLAGCAFLVAGFLINYSTPANLPPLVHISVFRDTIRGVKDIAHSPLLRSITLIVVLGSSTWALFDRQVYATVAARHLSETDVGVFYSSAYMWINIATVTAQLIALAWLRRGFNPIVGLSLLPLLAILFGVFGVILPTGSHWVIGWGCFASLAYSINHTSKEMMFLQVDVDQKVRAKATIDLVLFRVSEALGGLLLIATTAIGWNRAIGLIIAVIGAFWIISVRSVARCCSPHRIPPV